MELKTQYKCLSINNTMLVNEQSQFNSRQIATIQKSSTSEMTIEFPPKHLEKYLCVHNKISRTIFTDRLSYGKRKIKWKLVELKSHSHIVIVRSNNVIRHFYFFQFDFVN